MFMTLLFLPLTPPLVKLKNYYSMTFITNFTFSIALCFLSYCISLFPKVSSKSVGPLCVVLIDKGES